MHTILQKPDFGDNEKTFKAQILYTVMWTVVFAGTFLELFHILVLPANTLRWLFTLAVIYLVSGTVLFLNHRAHTMLAAYLFLVTFWWLITGLVYTDGGITSQVIPGWFVIVTLSGFILGKRGVAISVLMTILTGVALVYLDGIGQLPAVALSRTPPGVIVVSYLLYILVIVIIQVRYIENLRKMYFRIQREVEDRLESEKALMLSENFTDDLLQAVNVLVLGFDENGNIEIFNPMAEKICGYTHAEALSKNWLDLLVPGDFFGNEAIHIRKLFQQGCPNSFECPVLAKDGTVHYIALRCNVMKIHRRSLRIAFGLDITQHKQHEREQELISSISAALRAAETRADLLPAILEQLQVLFCSSFTAMIYRSSQREDELEVLEDAPAREILNGLISRWGDLNFALRSNEIYLNNALQELPEMKVFKERTDMRTLVSVPLISQGQNSGALLLIRGEKFLEKEILILKAVADIAANSLRRILSNEQTRRHVQRLAALHNLELAISNRFDLQNLFDTVLGQVVNQFHVDAADILLLGSDGLEIRYAAGKGFRSEVVEKNRGRVGESLVGTAVLTRSIIYIVNFPASDDDSDMQEIMQQEKFTSYYAVPLITRDVVKGVLEIFLRYHLAPQPDWLDFLQMLGSITAISIDDVELVQHLKQANLDLTNAYEATIEGWSHALDLRDRETEGHTQRVTKLTVKLARKMGFKEEELAHIRRGALLHDIGKMGVPDYILLKPGPLTDEEWAVMKLHPQYAYEMLSAIAYLHDALDIPYCHHEWWDGTGYPRGLKGEEIPLTARIFSVVDVWDALTSNRPYRLAWSEQKVIEHLRKRAGTHFDPQVVQVFIELMGQTAEAGY